MSYGAKLLFKKMAPLRRSKLQMNSTVSYQTRTVSSQKGWFYLLQWKPFKNDNKCFQFNVKSSFRS